MRRVGVHAALRSTAQRFGCSRILRARGHIMREYAARHRMPVTAVPKPYVIVRVKARHSA